MRVWILGSGTLLPHPLRGSPGYWVEMGEERILMDCGSGSLRTLARLGRSWWGVTHVVLTHFHTDHVGDLAPLLFALKHGSRPPRSAPLHLLAPRGLEGHLKALAEAHGSYVRDPGFPLALTELRPDGTWEAPSGSFVIRSFPTLHTDTALAYRVESANGNFGFTGDTGPVEGLGPFLSGCHLIVAECGNPGGSGRGNHLTPGELAALAKETRPDLLIVVHVYPPLDPGAVPDLLRQEGYAGWVEAGRDGMEVRISPGGVHLRPPDDREH